MEGEAHVDVFRTARWSQAKLSRVGYALGGLPHVHDREIGARLLRHRPERCLWRRCRGAARRGRCFCGVSDAKRLRWDHTATTTARSEGMHAFEHGSAPRFAGARRWRHVASGPRSAAQARVLARIRSALGNGVHPARSDAPASVLRGGVRESGRSVVRDSHALLVLRATRYVGRDDACRRAGGRAHVPPTIDVRLLLARHRTRSDPERRHRRL